MCAEASGAWTPPLEAAGAVEPWWEQPAKAAEEVSVGMVSQSGLESRSNIHLTNAQTHTQNWIEILSVRIVQ